ncbi:MAG: phage baseplate assembly protein V [bacterium]
MFEMMQGAQGGDGESINGVAVAVVTNNEDPQNLARVKVKYPWRQDEDESYWARIATFMGGSDRGGYFLPEVGDEVLVSFENGDIDHPFIIGALWSDKLKPPENNSDGKNNLRLIRSRSGHMVILDDTDGSEKIVIIDKSEKNLLTIDTSSNTIEISSEQDIKLNAPKGKILLDANELEFKAKANAKVQAQGNIDVKATGNNTIQGAMVMIN